jgi:protein ImuB
MHRVAEWATRFSPIVSIDPSSLEYPDGRDKPDFCPDGLILDITGCERTFKGEARLAFLISAGLRRFGFESRIGIGPTIGAAWAMARFGSGSKEEQGWLHAVPRGPLRETLRTTLGPLPVRALRLDGRTDEGLQELGIERIEQLLALPRAALPSRFGEVLTRRIDQAFGEAMEPIEPVRPLPPLRVEMQFDGPTTQLEAIESCARELVRELSAELLHRESGVRVLEVVCDRVGDNGRGVEPAKTRIVLSRATRDPKHLWSLLRPRFENLYLGSGIEAVALIASRTTKLRHRQTELRGSTPGGTPREAHGQSESELIDTLVNRLGPDRVLRPEFVESHIPERSTRMVSALADPPARIARALPVAAPRPTMLLEEPEPAEAIAMMPDRPPLLVRWRGREVKVALGVGPERIGSEWWRWSDEAKERSEDGNLAVPGALSPRDYFRVRDELGRWLWVFREVYTARWFVHGVWA